MEIRSGSGDRTVKGEANEGVPVADRLNEVLMSSQTRLRIAELVSRRPRSLRELARLTRLSVPGVLRHLEAMSKAGLIHEERVAPETLPVRKVYSLKGARVMDFSVGDLTIFKVAPEKVTRPRGPQDFEKLSMEILVGRRRIRDRARRLARLTDELLESEEVLTRGIDRLGLSDEERLILLTVFTEETTDDAERVLTRIQGMKEARRSIDKALAKVKR